MGHKEKAASPSHILHKVPEAGCHYPVEATKDSKRCRLQHGQTTDPHTGCSTPLISLLESARKGTLTAKEAAESAQQAIKLLGNASANMSVE